MHRHPHGMGNRLSEGRGSPYIDAMRGAMSGGCAETEPSGKERIMGLFTTPIKTLDDLFVHTLQDIYYAEQQITKALPTMIEKAQNPKLQTGFREHLQETKQHVVRLEQIFKELNQPVKGVTCQAIDGIIAEAKQVMSDISDPHVMDVALTTSAQAVEHYEISRYGSLIALAKQLGHNECVNTLHQTLQEEKAADEKLTEVAKAQVNPQAA
jgi:ferritin-like metal-binding protein YciE